MKNHNFHKKFFLSKNKLILLIFTVESIMKSLLILIETLKQDKKILLKLNGYQKLNQEK